MYHTIRTAAYEPDPAHGPWYEQLRVLCLGEDLHAELTRRHQEAHGGAGHPLRLPVRRLNSLLRALAPGVLATGRNAGMDGMLPWLYAREGVPKDILAPLLGTWASGLIRQDDENAEGFECADLEEELLADNANGIVRLPEWQLESVDLTETLVSHGGTAEPAQRLYSLLPEFLAFRLAARPFRARDNAMLYFRVVSTEQGAELVSWPPQRYERKKRTWYYSALVRITVHTVPFAQRFRVHVSSGVRRWATHLKVRPHELGGAKVLLDAPVPWSEGPRRGRRLTANSLGYDRRRKEVVWRRHSSAPLLPELDIIRSYPEPLDLFTAPETWLNGRQDIAAGIVYHPAIGPHEVGPGLMPRERAELGAWVEEGLRPVLRRVDDLTRVTRSNTPSLLPRSARANEPEDREAHLARQRRAALARALDGRPLDVEIHWQSPETRDALLSELPKLVGLASARCKEPGADTWQWHTDGIEINVRARPAGPLAGPLKISGSPKRRKAVRLAEAITERCALVADQADPPRGGLGLVLAEIAGKERFAIDSDPKHALRLAWARQGRLTQFMNLPDDTASDLEHRARWTWLDAFRQLGAISPPAHRVGAGVPRDLQYAALWLVRYTRRGPTRCPTQRLVAVRVRPGDGGPGDVEGWDAEQSRWVSYPSLLLSLATDTGTDDDTRNATGTDTAEKGSVQDGHGEVGRTASEGGSAEPQNTEEGEGAKQRRQREAERQIRALLFQLRDRPTLLLVSSGNLRQCWPRLRNGELVRDTLGFGNDPGQRHTVYGPDLRVLLVRDANERNEVAEWYAHDGEDKIGFAEGVWGEAAGENRVFASTASTPHTTSKLAKGLMKLVPAPENRTAPGKTAWNPGQLEVTVLGCLSKKALADSGREEETPDSPAEWATLAHQLRYHDDYPPLAHPLPLHLARLAKEYVLPLVQQDTQQPTGQDQPH